MNNVEKLKKAKAILDEAYDSRFSVLNDTYHSISLAAEILDEIIKSGEEKKVPFERTPAEINLYKNTIPKIEKSLTKLANRSKFVEVQGTCGKVMINPETISHIISVSHQKSSIYLSNGAVVLAEESLNSIIDKLK